ncbi:MAG TPA: 2-amino-4-hydroxy-6-hydroxymethyldihydropteridine diphosphokinase [Polyangia bacterium]|nr:2-amino-4-hydroxy-6-hydroxymethyldihydropteridine diphosphokinase [Polyangia bacterium]
MRYWIGLGSNVGDRLGTIRGAARALESLGIVMARSRVFAASAVGGPPQPPFLNAVMVLESDLDPAALLRACQQIEIDFGRARDQEKVRWGPRTLDLDVLMMGARGELRHAEPELEVPHPRLHERAFALAPLIDIDAKLIHPTAGRPLTALLHAAQSQGHVVAPTGDAL